MTFKSSFIPQIISSLTIISFTASLFIDCNQPKKSGVEIPLSAYIAANTGAALCLMYWLHACYQCGRQNSDTTANSHDDESDYPDSNTAYTSISTEPGE